MTIKINEHDIAARLLAENFTFFHHITVFDKVRSTNLEAKEYIKHNNPLPCILLAKQQLQGRGRFDRVWESPPGGVYLSCIMKLQTDAHHQTLFPLLFAVAVAETLRQNAVPAMIRWPNDVLVQSKKIAGILLETITNDVGYVCIIGGIGINFNNDIENCASDFRTIPTSVKQYLGKKVEYVAFIAQLIHQIEKYYNFFIVQNYNAILDQWRLLSNTLGKTVEISMHDTVILGKVVDIDTDGFLLVQMESGEIRKIMSGDCSYLNEF